MSETIGLARQAPLRSITGHDMPAVLDHGSVRVVEQLRLGKLLVQKTPNTAVTDVTDRNVQITISGPEARTVLAKGCPLDLSPEAFQPGQSARSLLGHAPVVIQLAAPTPDFRLTFDTSLAPYLWLWLEAATQEFTTNDS